MDLAHLPKALVVAGSLAGAVVMLAWRHRESRRPVTTRAIVAPPLGMATGFCMFLAPATRIPWSWAGAAFGIGAVVLSIPLAMTSRLVREGDTVMMKRSSAFFWILIGLFLVRFAAREWFEQRISMPQTGALFFVLAFGMIVRWRAGMYLDYVRLRGGYPSGVTTRPSA
jgi:membrane protein CcdC involved in cytochrome C biogenesis